MQTRLKMILLVFCCCAGLLCGCGVLGSRQSGWDWSKPDALTNITTGEQELGWAGIVIGTTRKAVEKTIRRPLTLKHEPSPSGGEYFAELFWYGRQVLLQLEGEQPGAKVQTVFVRFSEYENGFARAELVALLKEHIAGLRYRPGRYTPGVTETTDPAPVYTLDHLAGYALLLKPGEGLYLFVEGATPEESDGY